MLFNSLNFIAFLIFIVVLYYILPNRFRWVLLLLASYYFYTSWQPGPALLLIAITLVTYVCALGLRPEYPRRKGVLVAGVVLNVSALFVFKYTDFFLGSLEDLFQSFQWMQSITLPQLKLVLPVGLSFYTFSTISYLVDVYRGKMEAERHLGRLATYVAFFPKIFAGPIDRAITYLPQLRKHIHADPNNIIEGLQLFLWGLFKKVVIADRLAVFVDAAHRSPGFTPTIELIIAIYFYAFQIYCDFSGYTDMARGAAKLFGIDLMENFRRPYFSRSTAEFWGHRWHLSLCAWFRDYMYIPMGGSRVAWPRLYLNLMAVFAVSGLWHGANWTFIVWGALNGFYQWVGVATGRFWAWLGELLPRVRDSAIWSFIRVLFTFHLITFAWLFFRASSFSDAWRIITRIYKSWGMLPTMFRTYNYSTELLISLGLIVLLLVVEVLDERKPMFAWLRTKPLVLRWATYYLLIFALIILGKWGLAQFIYMQF